MNIDERWGCFCRCGEGCSQLSRSLRCYRQENLRGQRNRQLDRLSKIFRFSWFPCSHGVESKSLLPPLPRLLLFFQWFLFVVVSIKRWPICTSRPRGRLIIWTSSFWNGGSTSSMNIYLAFWNPSFWRPMPISRATSCSFWDAAATSTAKAPSPERSLNYSFINLTIIDQIPVLISACEFNESMNCHR